MWPHPRDTFYTQQGSFEVKASGKTESLYIFLSFPNFSQNTLHFSLFGT